MKVGDEDGGFHRWVGGRHNVTCNGPASRKVLAESCFKKVAKTLDINVPGTERKENEVNRRALRIPELEVGNL